MAAKFLKFIGFAEWIFSVFVGFISIIALIDISTPPKHVHMCSWAWSWLIFIITTPLTVLLGTASLALIKNFKRKWIWQLLPFIYVGGIVILGWWAENA